MNSMNYNTGFTVVFALWELGQWPGFVPIVCRNTRSNVTPNPSLKKKEKVKPKQKPELSAEWGNREVMN